VNEHVNEKKVFLTQCLKKQSFYLVFLVFKVVLLTINWKFLDCHSFWLLVWAFINL
jgi:hypothetical protein